MEAWITSGAPSDPAMIDAPGSEPDPLVSDEERGFWAFKTPVRPSIPLTKQSDWPQNGIDAFILRAIEQADLQPSSAASKETLIRRVYFDLLGIPPTVQQIEQFLNDDSPLAYEQMVERVLASPHYGERWGGLWLDLAGYSDSEGIQESDPVRPLTTYTAITSFVASMLTNPIRFLKEQLAGDDLADYTNPDRVSRSGGQPDCDWVSTAVFRWHLLQYHRFCTRSKSLHWCRH